MQEMTVINMAHAKVKQQKFMNSTGVGNSQSHVLGSSVHSNIRSRFGRSETVIVMPNPKVSIEIKVQSARRNVTSDNSIPLVVWGQSHQLLV
jgi:hypothetical protein